MARLSTSPVWPAAGPRLNGRVGLRAASLRHDPGLWLLLHLRPWRDRRLDQHGVCAVCGVETRFVRNSWILSKDLVAALAPGFADRESLLCASCGSSRRVRRIAEVLVGLYAESAHSIASLVDEPDFRRLRIAEVNGIGRMHPFLTSLPGLVSSEYPQEDVMALSYQDSTFDLVLTSETMEHVPDPIAGFRETLRVLRPGGRHVFTVPVDPRRQMSRSRAGLPAQHHGRGGGPFAFVTRKADMLVHTDFGLDLPALVRDVGYEVSVDGTGVEIVVIATRPPSETQHGTACSR